MLSVLVLVPTIALALPLQGQDQEVAHSSRREAWDQLEGETVNMLDAIVQLMTGSGEFDRHVDKTVFSSKVHSNPQELFVQAEYMHELHLSRPLGRE